MSLSTALGAVETLSSCSGLPWSTFDINCKSWSHPSSEVSGELVFGIGKGVLESDCESWSEDASGCGTIFRSPAYL